MTAGDVIFTKDGKIACVGMITSADNVILSSGIERLRLTPKSQEEGLTQEYLFTALSIPEIGKYAAVRRTVVASTIPHLRVERLKDIEIPLMDQEVIDRITQLVKKAFCLKSKRKQIPDAVVNYRYHKAPLLDGTLPFKLSSIFTAALSARANALKAHSIMWCVFFPAS